MKTRILVVDDHRMYRDGLKALLALQSDMEVVGEAENGQEAIAKTRKLRPDVVLMDVKMPVMDGVEATRQIITEMPNMKILALTMCSVARMRHGHNARWCPRLHREGRRVRGIRPRLSAR